MGITGHRRRAGLGGVYAAPFRALALLICASCGKGGDPVDSAQSADQGLDQRSAQDPEQDPDHAAETSELIQQALAAFEQAGERTYSDPTPRMLLIREALRNGRRKRVAELVRMELDEHPKSTEAMLVGCWLFYQRAAVKAARARLEIVLKIVIERGPTFEGGERIFYLYGVCLLRLGQADLAREALLAHLKLKPGHAETIFSLGEIALQEGQSQAAIPYLEQALEEFETNESRPARLKRFDIARAQSALGTAYRNLNDLERARDALETSLRLNPDDVATEYSLSRVLARLGDQEGARRSMERFRKLYKQRADRNVIPGPGGRNSGGGQ